MECHKGFDHCSCVSHKKKPKRSNVTQVNYCMAFSQKKKNVVEMCFNISWWPIFLDFLKQIETKERATEKGRLYNFLEFFKFTYQYIETNNISGCWPLSDIFFKLESQNVISQQKKKHVVEHN